jgi:putative addiction module component (TIGR02574 family)
MIQTIDELAQCASELPPEQRFTLARRILASVEPQEDTAIDSAWAAEIRERINRYDSGQIKGIPASEVFAEVDRRLTR